ncbi:MAG: ferredoxin family protein [Thermaerobacter sp.]|nr:ferredoxin family protein [Thermaerobacter sp.]
MAYVIAEPCIGVKDKSCVDVCPVDCIHGTDDDEQLYINPDDCINCGACEAVCPVNAIFEEAMLPDAWLGYKEKNRAYYDKG